MTDRNGRPLDTALIERTRFEQSPECCITEENVAGFAGLLRRVPEYHRALDRSKAVAVPEERSRVLRRVVKPAVEGWLLLDMRWDVSLYNAGEYSSIRAFLLDGGEVLCVVNARDRDTMHSMHMTPEAFARLFMEAWLKRDSAVTYYDAAAMNAELRAVYTRVFEEHAVKAEFIADGGLCKALLTLLKA